MLSLLDYIFSSSDLPPIWFLGPNLVEIEIFGEQPPVFHACAYSNSRITSNWLVHVDRLSNVRLLEACLSISDCWRRSGTTSSAMPRAVVVLSSMYKITGSSHKYKDGVVGIFSFCHTF